MRRYLIGFAAIAVVATSAYAVAVGVQRCATPASDKQKVSTGAIKGNFDPAMSGVCQFGCATKLEYKAADVVAQPGAESGSLTQCPVSGVVFVVDENRPTVSAAGKEFKTCCDNCAKKLRNDPSHYLKV